MTAPRTPHPSRLPLDSTRRRAPAARAASGVLVAALGLALLGASDASAEGGDEADFFALEEAIVTLATKKPEEAHLAPSIVFVIPRRAITERGFRSVGEALQTVPGFFALDDGVFTNFGVRGVNAGARGGSRILKVLLDGQPIAFRATTANFLGPELIPMSAVERIEVVRGPGSALYGANAFLGVVNVITRRPSTGTPDDPDAKESETFATVLAHATYLEATGRGGARIEGTGGGRRGPFEAMVTAQYDYLDRSELGAPETSPLRAQLEAAGRTRADDDLSKPSNLYARLAYDDAKGMGVFTVHGGMSHLDAVNEWQDLGPLPTTTSGAGDPLAERSRQSLVNGFARVLWEKAPTDTVELTASAAYAAGGPTGDDRFDTGQQEAYFLRQYGYQSVDVTGQGAWEPMSALHLTLGADHTTDVHDLLTYRQKQRGRGGDEQELQEDRDKTINNTGVFAQGIYEPTDDLAITLGLRLDVNSIYHEQWSGRAGLVYQIVDGLSAKLLFGSSFQAPSPELLFGELSQAGDVIGNEKLDPQRALSWEAAIAWENETVTAQLNGFYNRIDDLAAFERQGQNLRAVNAVDLDSLGFELSGTIRLGDLQVRGQTAYQRTLRRDRDPASPSNLFPTREIDLFPRWMVGGGLTYKLPALPVTVALDVKWVDERLASQSNVTVNLIPYELSDYLLANLTVATAGLEVGGVRPEIRFQVLDLFDQAPFRGGFNGIDVPTLGRRFVLTAGVSF